MNSPNKAFSTESQSQQQYVKVKPTMTSYLHSLGNAHNPRQCKYINTRADHFNYSMDDNKMSVLNPSASLIASEADDINQETEE